METPKSYTARISVTFDLEYDAASSLNLDDEVTFIVVAKIVQANLKYDRNGEPRLEFVLKAKEARVLTRVEQIVEPAVSDLVWVSNG